MLVYAVRHKNGNYLPVTGKRSTHHEFQKQTNVPRLFAHKRAAQNFVLYWARGKIVSIKEEPYGPDFFDDGSYRLEITPMGRSASVLKVVTFELKEIV